jgi:hypothetical protein
MFGVSFQASDFGKAAKIKKPDDYGSNKKQEQSFNPATV